MSVHAQLCISHNTNGVHSSLCLLFVLMVSTSVWKGCRNMSPFHVPGSLSAPSFLLSSVFLPQNSRSRSRRQQASWRSSDTRQGGVPSLYPQMLIPLRFLAATNLPQTLSAPEIILSSRPDSTLPSRGLPEDLPVTQIQPFLIPGFKIIYFNNRKNKLSFKNRQKTCLDVSPKKLDNDQ